MVVNLNIFEVNMEFRQIIYEFIEKTLREKGEINAVQMDILNRLIVFVEGRTGE